MKKKIKSILDKLYILEPKLFFSKHQNYFQSKKNFNLTFSSRSTWYKKVSRIGRFFKFFGFALSKSVVKNSWPRDEFCRKKQGENNVSFWKEKGGACSGLAQFAPEKEQLRSDSIVSIHTNFLGFWANF
mgnify:CR=1 FL=1